MNRDLVNERLEYVNEYTGREIKINPDTVHLQVAICFVTIASLFSANKRILWNMFRYSKKVSEVVKEVG